MITLFRWISLKKKEIKYKLMLYTILDETMKDLSTGELKGKLLEEAVPYLAMLAHATVQAEKNKTE